MSQKHAARFFGAFRTLHVQSNVCPNEPGETKIR